MSPVPSSTVSAIVIGSILALTGLVSCLVATAARQEPGLAARVAPELVIVADARDLPRGLLRCSETIPVAPGPLRLWYPRWIPGIHAPNGPIENVGELRIRTIAGQELPWRRDSGHPERFDLNIPTGCTTIQVDLTYLANQPSVNSVGVDSFGSVRTGVINWNTCLLYPEGWRHDQMAVRASLILPSRWRHASALTSSGNQDGMVRFARTDLRVLVDSPVIAGSDLASHDISVPGMPPAFIDVVAEPPAKAALPDQAISDLQALVAEAGQLFGGAPWASYHLLVTAGSTVPHTGLEHAACSLNGLDGSSLVDDGKLAPEAAFLLAHEFGHAWCGKHHRPRGMDTPDFHTDPRQRLLWVYEGLDQWLGMVLVARAGLVDRQQWHQRFEHYLDEVALSRSRRWRTVEDTACVSHLLRQPSQAWGYLRGRQDYYLEGMLFWMEADGLIRQHSDGQRSLDDFCRDLLGSRRVGQVVPYDESDVITALTVVDPKQDWAALVERRIRNIGEPPLDTLKAVGYQVTWEVDRQSRATQVRNGYVDARYSLGLVAARGKIVEVIPGSAADLAGLGEDMRLMDVAGKPYSARSLIEAIDACSDGDSIAVKVQPPEGTVFTATLACAGPRSLAVTPIPDAPDLLTRILAPRRTIAVTAP